MSVPLFISQCVRRNGVTFLTVYGHGFSQAHEGLPITVNGVSDPSVNVTGVISKVIQPDTIQFKQPGKIDIPNGLVGGAIAVG